MTVADTSPKSGNSFADTQENWNTEAIAKIIIVKFDFIIAMITFVAIQFMEKCFRILHQHLAKGLT
jgi:hypothetical protein